jgi:hypothetical protein
LDPSSTGRIQQFKPEGPPKTLKRVFFILRLIGTIEYLRDDAGIAIVQDNAVGRVKLMGIARC